MAVEIFSYLQELYEGFLAKGDPRVEHMFLLQGLGPIFLILLIYIVAVCYGPRVMEAYKPFQLTYLIVAYNFTMVLLSLYVALEVLRLAAIQNYSLLCQPVDYSWNFYPLACCDVGWWFFFLKVIELADTIFFVLRKKNEQITFLHVYHHGTMVLVGWLSVKFVPGGQAFFYPLINSLVHVVMYTYYGIAAMGPSMRKYLWWKRYLTIFQLVQFVFMLTHTAINAVIPCDFPKTFNYCVFVYAFFIMLLFLNFYHKAYLQKKQIKQNGVNGLKKHS